MELEETKDLKASWETLSSGARPKTARLAKIAFILGLIGIVLLFLAFIVPALFSHALSKTPFNALMFIAMTGVAASLGILLALVSVIIGIIALMRIGRSDGMLKGKAWALSGLLMGLLPLLLIGGLIIESLVMAASASRAYATRPFKPAQYKGETGTIILSYKGESALTLYGNGENIRLTTTDGTFTAPVGAYKVLSYEVSANDEKNTRWIASSYPRSTSVAVQDGIPAQLEIGPPLTASVEIKTKPNDQVSMTFNLKDKMGNSYTISNSAPSFQVISQSGDVFWQGKFQFG